MARCVWPQSRSRIWCAAKCLQAAKKGVKTLASDSRERSKNDIISASEIGWNYCKLRGDFWTEPM
jgi:hypothetical protein